MRDACGQVETAMISLRDWQRSSLAKRSVPNRAGLFFETIDEGLREHSRYL
jgi:hypothetical protein